MTNISLVGNGWIGVKEPCGKKITASTLEIGKTYLHQNRGFLRTIVDIFGNQVIYCDRFSIFNRPCSRAYFTKICPNEATGNKLSISIRIIKSLTPII